MITQPALPPLQAAPPDLIPGIHNYCDLWCERCPLTARCRSFQVQHANGSSNEANPNASLVHQLTEALNMTKCYVETLHRQQRLSSSDTPTLEEQQRLEAQVVTKRSLAKEHPASRLALAYLTQTGTWLAHERGMLERAGKRQLRNIDLGIQEEGDAMIVLNTLKEAYDQIRWYRTLIPVKTTSALRLVDEPTNDESLLDYYNGKAKLVLVSINRSLVAWHTVLAFCPEKTDDLLDILITLSRLNTCIHTTFPKARAFQRPGLD